MVPSVPSVEVGIPGYWPIRVTVEERRGFGKILVAAHELAFEGDGSRS